MHFHAIKKSNYQILLLLLLLPILKYDERKSPADEWIVHFIIVVSPCPEKGVLPVHVLSSCTYQTTAPSGQSETRMPTTVLVLVPYLPLLHAHAGRSTPVALAPSMHFVVGLCRSTTSSPCAWYSFVAHIYRPLAPKIIS